LVFPSEPSRHGRPHAVAESKADSARDDQQHEVDFHLFLSAQKERLVMGVNQQQPRVLETTAKGRAVVKITFAALHRSRNSDKSAGGF
jgi:hypothetical protein